MRLIQDVIIAKNTGMAFTINKGQHIRVTGESTADFVAFNLDNLKERFDQARTKTEQLKIFLSTGDRLISKFSDDMLTIVEDTFKEGTHDLQKGMCNAKVYQRMYDGGFYFEPGRIYSKVMPTDLGLKRENLPDHGCWENLSEALTPWNIAPEDIPSPFNMFQHMSVDGETGEMRFMRTKPKPNTYVELRAEMNLLVAISACPERDAGKALRVQIYE